MRCKQYVVPEPKLEYPNADSGLIIFPKPDRYLSRENQHHWTTSYVWFHALPIFFNDFNITFNINDWDACNNIVSSEDYSYHKLKSSDDYVITIYDNNQSRSMLVNDLRCNAMRDEAISPYHALFIGAHKTCIITNDTINTDRCLLLNCDSMAIPVVPILAHYFHKIIHLDSRDHMDIKIQHLFEWEEVTDYMALFTSMSWFTYGKPFKQLHPYIKSNT